MARILLVDDEEHILEYYREELSDDGHQVVALNSGHQLMSEIRRHRPEIVVLDVRLVDYDGLELLQEIRIHYDDLPVILCTAYDSFLEDMRAVAADYYVIKSFDLSELKSRIRQACVGRFPAPAG